MNQSINRLINALESLFEPDVCWYLRAYDKVLWPPYLLRLLPSDVTIEVAKN